MSPIRQQKPKEQRNAQDVPEPCFKWESWSLRELQAAYALENLPEQLNDLQRRVLSAALTYELEDPLVIWGALAAPATLESWYLSSDIWDHQGVEEIGDVVCRWGRRAGSR